MRCQGAPEAPLKNGFLTDKASLMVSLSNHAQCHCHQIACAPRSDVSGQDAIRWAVAVEEGADVDDHLLTHIDAALDGGRSHVGQDDDPVFLSEFQELGID